MKRDQIRNMFGGKCAYCGIALGKVFHVDHVDPIYRGWEVKPDQAGEDVPDNLFPSCPRCNRWKKTFTVEQFRFEISQQIQRLRRDSAAFRLAEDYEMIKETTSPVVFYFEWYNPTSLPTPSPQQ